jgi:hypothetical protein
MRILTDEELEDAYKMPSATNGYKDWWDKDYAVYHSIAVCQDSKTARLVREETIGMVNNLLINTDYCIGQYKIDGCDDVDYVLADKEDGDPIDSGQNMTSETLKKQVREETLKDIIKWGMEECQHKRNYMSSDGRRKKPVVTLPSGLLKRECPICWAEKLSQGVMP